MQTVLLKILNLFMYYTCYLCICIYMYMYFFQIVLMVVGTDSVHTKEYSHVNQKLAENTNHQDSDLCSSGIVYDS